MGRKGGKGKEKEGEGGLIEIKGRETRIYYTGLKTWNGMGRKGRKGKEKKRRGVIDIKGRETRIHITWLKT